METPVAPATLLTIEHGRAVITLNRPQNRNALSVELVESLADNLAQSIADPSANVIVLTGEGSVFCAGADLKERRTVQADGDELPTFVKIFQAIQASPKPVVAKLNGSALAGGLGLVCSCDFAIAPTTAMFGFTEVRIGVSPAIISVVCLPKMRTNDAVELFLTGERIDAVRAEQVGLIHRAVPAEQLDEAVEALVGKLLLGGPKALAATKDLLRQIPTFANQTDAFKWAAKLSASLFASDEGKEGMAAFAEKRKPSWVPSA